MEVQMDRKNQKPRRQKKSDRILHSGQTQNQIMTDYAVAPFDRKAEEMDEKWGIDRLVELVSAETAARYGSAMAKFNDAIDAGDPSVTAARAQVCIRGMEAMDAEATAAGAQRASMDVWEVEVAGELYGVMRDARSWQASSKGPSSRASETARKSWPSQTETLRTRYRSDEKQYQRREFRGTHRRERLPRPLGGSRQDGTLRRSQAKPKHAMRNRSADGSMAGRCTDQAFR